MKKSVFTLLGIALTAVVLPAMMSCESKRVATEETPDDWYAQGCDYEDAGKYEQAAALFTQAADSGNRYAMRHLGELYAEGLGVERDDSLAVMYYTKSAEQGLAHAQFLLAGMYAQGRGVERDDTIAAAWYLKAAEQRHLEAMYRLGEMYAEGRGVPQNAEEAKRWIQSAIAAGYAEPGI